MAISTVFSTEKQTGVSENKSKENNTQQCMTVCFPSYLVTFQVCKTMPILSEVDASVLKWHGWDPAVI